MLKRSELSRSLGALQSSDWSDNVFTGSTETGDFRIRFYSQSIIRIHISRDGDFDELPYVVTGLPLDTEVTLEEDDDAVILSSSQLKLEIRKDPVRFRITDADGKVINEDEPAFGTSWQGDHVTSYKRLQAGERFVGLGEKTGDLDRRGKYHVNWTTDKFGYDHENDPYYCAFPFYIGIHAGLVYGIYLNNSYRSHFNFGASNDRFSSFGAEFGDMDYFFLGGNSLADVLKNYSQITGSMPLPPLWSLGFQQCRYSYFPDKEVLNVASTFRVKEIPADAVVLDIHYMDQYKIFTWSDDRFPDPKAMINELGGMDFKIVVILDPGIKVEDGYEIYEDGLKKGVFIKYPDSTPYTGQVWPGWCHFPDFTNPEVREWWAGKFDGLVEAGVTGFWNDMNEFATWGHTVPELLEFDFDGERVSSLKARNLYGLLMARSTYEAVVPKINKRPFNLTRSAFSGIQRYSALWTGDNTSSDEHIMVGVRLVNSLGLTGVPFTGYDVGGFSGNSTVELYARWLSIGAFSPFFRAHSMVNSNDAEPWSFGEHVEEIARNYISFRYRLLPYLYSIFYEASQSGLPVCRSLAIDYTHDQRVYEDPYQNQYMFGPSLLVVPVSSTQDFCRVFLPEGEWYDLHSGAMIKGGTEILSESPLDRLPVFVKSGSFLLMQSQVQSTSENHDGALRVHLYNGDKGSHFEYYEDDGISFDYRDQNYLRRTLDFNPSEKVITMGEVTGKYVSKFDQIILILHGFSELGKIRVDDNTVEINREEIQFFKPLTNFDPIAAPQEKVDEQVQSVSFKNSSNKVTISYA